MRLLSDTFLLSLALWLGPGVLASPLLREQLDLPDLSQYVPHGSLSGKQLHLGDSASRAIIVGDIHGMYDSLQRLLREVHYNPTKDTLLHVGDISTRGPQYHSVLTFLSSHNISGVRGNNDQAVIEWRAWIEWITRLEKGAGRRWLESLESRWAADRQEPGFEMEVEEWTERQKHKCKKQHRRWWKTIPEGWQLFTDQYNVARALVPKHYEYLRSLPVVLHLPSEHTFIVHGGLLPYDPTRRETSSRQPLARVPHGSSIPALRKSQERAILHDIKHNTDPWVVMNIRSVLNNNTISRSKEEGTPWADIWNRAMGRCGGYGAHDLSRGSDLPCLPSTVVYGHTASRGLDISRWTVGLDTGCVYGRQLTAMVIQTPHQHKASTADDEDEDFPETPASIPFGDSGRARLVSVPCPSQEGEDFMTAQRVLTM
ncbi:Metallo-dependent phosphatase [Auriscalpium vulgare]|uniref:Metallo-dependent phosphatase n=1 Tax=Auriscalpium vulgare TaxID=40419 RepID=A0ACB8RQ53_9AGAM|nr:Metallo-dependent phosphatase [Auriscalpium vulgare]